MLKKTIVSLLAALLLLPAASSAQTTIKFSSVNADTSWSTVNGLIPWLKKMEADSKGELKFELYANQTLTKGNQAWNAVRNGIADAAWIPMGMYPGMNPLLDVVALGGLNYSDALTATGKVWDFYEKSEAVRKPYAANRLLALYTTDVAFIMSKTPIKTLADMKGKRIRCTAVYVDWLKTLGAVPIVMNMPEVYMAIQKGTIDGLIGDWESMTGYRFYEVAKYVTDNLPVGVVCFAIGMNQKAYDRLPEQGKQAIDMNSGRAGSLWLAKHFSYDSRDLSKDLIADGRVDYYALPAAERAEWEKIVGKPLWDNWEANMAKKNLGGDAKQALEIMTK